MMDLSEEKRLDALRSLNITDEDLREELNGLTRLASRICETPISMVNLVDASRQIVKSSQGWDIDEMPREESFCQHTILEDELLIVENTLDDDRFKDSPYVTNDPEIRFYAGMPLLAAGGGNVGAICVIDTKPRVITEEQKESLRLLADEVVARFESKQKEVMLKTRNNDLEKAAKFLQNSSDIQAIIDAETLNILEINSDTVNLLGGAEQDYVGLGFGNRFANEEDRKSNLAQ